MSDIDVFKEKIENIFSQIKEDSIIQTILINYIHTAPKIIFISKDHWILFEYSIFKKYNIGQKLLWSNNIISFLSSKKLKKGKILLFEPEVKEYITEYFLMLVKLIKEKVPLENEAEQVFLTLRLLQYISVLYSAALFDQTYGHFYKEIELLTLEQCIEIFYCEKEIDSNSIVNQSLFSYYLMHNNKFDQNNNFLICRIKLKLYINKNKEHLKLKLWEKKLTIEIPLSNEYTISDLDLMSGSEFERFVSTIFRKMGYHTTITQQTSDQGIDIIAEKDGVRIGIQAKCYSGSVSNTAIQEVVAGLRYYACTKGIVVTNSYFTKSARELAAPNDIKLWDRKILKEKIKIVDKGCGDN